MWRKKHREGEREKHGVTFFIKLYSTVFHFTNQKTCHTFSLHGCMRSVNLPFTPADFHEP